MRTKLVGSVLVFSLLLTAMTATVAGADPAIANACPDRRVPPSWFDETYPNTHADAIDGVVWYGIANGVADERYEPRADVRRDQMASFMARSVTAMPGQLPSGAATFRDVSGGAYGRAIEQLAATGIVRGTSSTEYSPSRPATRAQMATFLVRTYRHLTGEQLSASRDDFTDDGNTHEININKPLQPRSPAGSVTGCTARPRRCDAARWRPSSPG